MSSEELLEDTILDLSGRHYLTDKEIQRLYNTQEKLESIERKREE